MSWHMFAVFLGGQSRQYKQQQSDTIARGSHLTPSPLSSPGLLWLFPGVVVEQAVRVKAHQFLLVVVHQGGREELDEVEVGEEGDAVVDGCAADGVVVLQALALGGGKIDHQVDLLAADVVDHVRSLVLQKKKTKKKKSTTKLKKIAQKKRKR